MLTQNELSWIRARVERATSGPWGPGVGPYGWDDGIIQAGTRATSSHGVIITNSGHGETSLNQDDAEFIASARTDIPALLDHIAALEAEIVALRGLLGDAQTREGIARARAEPGG